MSNNFEGSFTEEGVRAGKAIFKGVSKFAVSEANKMFNRKASEVQIYDRGRLVCISIHSRVSKIEG